MPPAHVDLLAGLPHPLILDVRGFGPVAFCHGTPRDDNEVVLVDTRLDRWAEAFAGLPDEVRTVVCGHTHMPFARLVDRRLVVNPGSVGMPYGRAGGHWALLKDGGVSLRRVEVDVDAAIAAVVAGSAYPDRAAWAEDYLRATESDADAIAAFGPRDGRDALTRDCLQGVLESGPGHERVRRPLVRAADLGQEFRYVVQPPAQPVERQRVLVDRPPGPARVPCGVLVAADHPPQVSLGPGQRGHVPVDQAQSGPRAQQVAWVGLAVRDDMGPARLPDPAEQLVESPESLAQRPFVPGQEVTTRLGAGLSAYA